MYLQMFANDQTCYFYCCVVKCKTILAQVHIKYQSFLKNFEKIIFIHNSFYTCKVIALVSQKNARPWTTANNWPTATCKKVLLQQGSSQTQKRIILLPANDCNLQIIDQLIIRQNTTRQPLSVILFVSYSSGYILST